jgi:hypothetical protein
VTAGKSLLRVLYSGTIFKIGEILDPKGCKTDETDRHKKKCRPQKKKRKKKQDREEIDKIVRRKTK